MAAKGAELWDGLNGSSSSVRGLRVAEFVTSDDIDSFFGNKKNKNWFLRFRGEKLKNGEKEVVRFIESPTNIGTVRENGIDHLSQLIETIPMSYLKKIF
jgi:hypothetical protein